MSRDLIRVINLKKYFPFKKGFPIFSRSKEFIRAIDGITFNIGDGETFGLAGESGSGKTTLGRLLALLEYRTDGRILFDGLELSRLSRRQLKEFRRNVQMIFQDPYTSLDPRINVEGCVSEPLEIQKIGSAEEQKERVIKLLKVVGLSPDYIDKYPHELSGGERQRVCIARTLALNPKFIIADEPISMLDVSIRASILKLLKELKKEIKFTSLFISHDLNVMPYLCDRIAIMYLGKIVELGTIEQVLHETKHPYTEILISAVPDPYYKAEKKISIIGEPQQEAPSGCRFYPRCPLSKDSCKEKEPMLIEVEHGHFVACHLL